MTWVTPNPNLDPNLESRTLMLFGDARRTLAELVRALKGT
jgi:hypothetical protein